MHYVGRHRTARPFYLRRPVMGGALLAAVIAVPALALTGQGPGLLGAKEPTSPTTTSKASAASPAVVVPTDGILPSDSPVAPTTSRATTSAPASSSAAPRTSAAQTTAPTTTTTSRAPTKTPTKTTTKAPDPTLTTSLSAPAGTVGVAYAGSITASGGSGTYSFSSSGRPAWLGFVSTASRATFAGTPTAAGTFSFTITVKSGTQTRSVPVTVKVSAAAPPSSSAPAA